MKANKMEEMVERQLQRSVNVKTMKTSSGKVRKRRTAQTKRRKLRGTVVKMLAMMESKPESSDPVMEFLVTGRTGRRNAMADILGPHAAVTSGDLPEKLQSLSTADPEAGPSTSQDPEEEENKNCPRPSQEENNDAESKEKETKEEQEDEEENNSPEKASISSQENGFG